MAKQSNNKKSNAAEKLGKGKVTSVQVAFIVDRYLCDNNYTQTRRTFRSEASDLISVSPVQEAPKSLLSLGAMLDEYISLKEQRVLLNQERHRLEQDKFRVQNLLKGLQDSMNAFNASANLLTAPLALPNFATIAPNSGNTATSPELPIESPAGCYSALNTPVVQSRSNPNTTVANPCLVSIPATNHTNLKRKGFKDGPDDPPTAKRYRKSSTTKHLNLKDSNSQSHQAKGGSNRQPWKSLAVESLLNSNAPSGSCVEGQGVVKCLFTQQAQSPPTASSGPKTPPLASSSQAENLDSPLELHSSATSSKNVNQELTTNCTITSTETIQVSPNKQISYYSITRNHQISTFSPIKPNSKRSNIRDHVKGRLNFDVTDDQINTEIAASDRTFSPESFEEADILDLDLASLEALGNMNLSQLLLDFDIDGPVTCQQHADTTPESTLCSSRLGDVHNESEGFMSQISSTVTKILADNEMDSSAFMSGVDSVTTRRSVTKCIQISSPAKSQMRLLDQEPSMHA